MRRLGIALGVAFLLALAAEVVVNCTGYDPCSWWTWLVASQCYSCPSGAGGGGSGAS